MKKGDGIVSQNVIKSSSKNFCHKDQSQKKIICTQKTIIGLQFSN